MNSPYHDLSGGLAERRQDHDVIGGDGSYFFCPHAFSLYPAVFLRKLIVFDYYDELSLLEAQECGVICRGTNQLAEVALK